MSTAAIPVHVALVDTTGEIPTADLAQLAGAVNEQIQHDFAPVWKVAATVGAYPAAPAGTWAVIVQRKLDQPGALGYHTDANNQPISYVEYTPDYPVTVSHETLEMLADPYGSRVHSARLPDELDADFKQFGLSTRAQHVRYLLEVCDPCEETSYEVGGVALSDFLHPYWYRTSPLSQPAYSQAGGCVSPREVAPGGYVSFCNQFDDWFQVFNQDGRLQVQNLGRFSQSAHNSLREWTDEQAREHRAS